MATNKGIKTTTNAPERTLLAAFRKADPVQRNLARAMLGQGLEGPLAPLSHVLEEAVSQQVTDDVYETVRRITKECHTISALALAIKTLARKDELGRKDVELMCDNIHKTASATALVFDVIPVPEENPELPNIITEAHIECDKILSLSRITRSLFDIERPLTAPDDTNVFLLVLLLEDLADDLLQMAQEAVNRWLTEKRPTPSTLAEQCNA